jgi:hypothetical protein
MITSLVSYWWKTKAFWWRIRAARELLICLKRILERISPDKSVRYLPDSAVAKLMNWDAEKYRIALARMET